MDASEKVDWNIILYFGIALECDSPIINSLVQCRPTLVASLMCKSLQKYARFRLSQLPPIMHDEFRFIQVAYGKYKGEFKVKSRTDRSSASFKILRGVVLVVKIKSQRCVGVFQTRTSELGRRKRVCDDKVIFDVGSWFLATCRLFVSFICETQNIRRTVQERLLTSAQEASVFQCDRYFN